MKIRVGLLEKTAMWEELLTQEGVPFEAIHSGQSISPQEFSAIVLNRRLTSDENASLREYLRGGGAILSRSDHAKGLGGFNIRTENIEYLFGDEIFPLDLTDINRESFIVSEANCLRTEKNTHSTFAGEFCGGVALLLPFDIAEVMEDCRVAEKMFYAHRERLPSERVSMVSKGNVRLLLHYGLQSLHHARGIPFVHLSSFPAKEDTLFAFRIDSDGASAKEVAELYSLGREYEIPMSWYLDVQSHERWLQRFTEMQGQEIGVHCYQHRSYDDPGPLKENVEHAATLLEDIGIRRSGFSAPYGMWSPTLAQVLDELGFEYSSEFSYAYDTLPLTPSVHEKRFQTLQIPIHPICIGNLLRVGYSPQDQERYFSSVVKSKRQRAEPLFFYHHPSHKNLDVVRNLFETMRNENIRCVSMGEYAAWWKKRSLVKLGIQQTNDDIVSTMADPQAQDLMVKISRADEMQALAPLNGTHSLRSLDWASVPVPSPLADDFRRVKEFDLRQSIGSVFTRFQRDFR